MCTSRRKTSVFRVKTRGKRFDWACVRLYARTDNFELPTLFLREGPMWALLWERAEVGIGLVVDLFSEVDVFVAVEVEEGLEEQAPDSSK